jgi:flagellar motor switch protein FliM
LRSSAAKQPAIAAKFLLQAINRGGEMFVIVPQSALTRCASPRPRHFRHRTPATQTDQADAQGGPACTATTGVLKRTTSTSHDSELKVGQVLKPQSTPREPHQLESNHQPLWCHLANGKASTRSASTIVRSDQSLTPLCPQVSLPALFWRAPPRRSHR